VKSWLASLAFGVLYRISFEHEDRDGSRLTLKMHVRPRFGWAPQSSDIEKIWHGATATCNSLEVEDQ